MKSTDNSDELFDVVNDKDEVIGQATRGEVHKNKKLIHRSIGVAVFNSKGELFLQKRSATKDTDPLLWTISCSGHVRSGNDYDETAIRELKEELALEGELKHLFKIRYKHPRGCYVFTDLWLMPNPSLIEEKKFDKTEVFEIMLSDFAELKVSITQNQGMFQPQLRELVHRWRILYGSTATPNNNR